MAKFEKVSRFKDADFPMPSRATTNSAGYDLVAAEDTVIPSYWSLMNRMAADMSHEYQDEMNKNLEMTAEILNNGEELVITDLPPIMTLNMKEMADATKRCAVRPTLVSTGVKCQLEPNTYLELSVRSSTPLKYWLVLANSVGIIDADYYNNSNNEGEIFLQLINLSLYDIQIKKGEAIGQGIIKSYLITEDDNATGVRAGGFGSTSK